ncbi:hypothetical protein [Pseudomonas gingeri]|uniref:hypothetical protein n=1 Tax=Pseudomonas gingeri TaxID=117681 RepID=UPI0015A3BD21|nr:hypothetical protein [Pseudomonas gingeri]NWD09803.1 hypothetical protein [Pseudomonas gingeri]NWE36732.1 hypothetical protein [Pseudomonas gingeri]NWE61111.1 hypothetical protein [Pseudomonas gingeri]NWF04718.1 hypothetical protein [Pseudomonas gingeri]
MDRMQFVSAIVASLAWPAAVVGLALLLRSPLAGLLPKIRSFKYGDFHIDLSEKLEVVEDEVNANASKESPKPHPPPSPNVVELAAIDPRAAIVTSWIEVEDELKKLAAKHSIAPGQSPITTANLLHAADILDELTFKTFVRLRSIRNDAVHSRHMSIDFDEAVTMANMCQWLINQLRIANSLTS